MSEEEKEIIDYFKNLDIDLNTLCRIDLKGLEKRRKQILKLVEKQQKEIEELEEKNDRQRWLIRQLDKENTIPNIDDKILEYISKDKIREKLDYQYELWNTPNRQKEYNLELVEVLEELLGEENE